MANKAYIVANEQQECEVLDKLEREGMTWSIINEKPTDNKPSSWFKISIFPYIIFVEKNTVTWNFISRLEDEEVVFDGRKEEQMSDKYVVSQEFMNELNIWKTNLKSYDDINNYFVGTGDLRNLPILANLWASDRHITNKEHNNRLIAIIRWVNGEDVFEVEKPKKWVVRSKETDEYGEYRYTRLMNFAKLVYPICGTEGDVTKFDTKEEAESWANSHQEVRELIEVKE